MRAFVQKPNTRQPTTSAKASLVSRAHVAQGHDPNSILNLQRKLGNQALVRLLQNNAAERNAEFTGMAPPQFEHDFSRIPVGPRAGGTIQTKLAINATGDEYEQEADRVAAQVMRMPELKLRRNGARLSNARAGILIGASNDPLEREADAAAQRANEDAAPGIASASLSAGASRVARAPMLQRDDGPGEKKEETQLSRVPYRDKPADEKQSQEDESEKGPALVSASAARPTCDPKGLKRQDYLAQPNTSMDDFGLTRLSGAVKMALPTRKVRGGVALEPLQVALPPITSVFTTADTFIEGTLVFVSQGGAECPSGKMPMQWRIWPTGAAKIREGELEHCEDIHYAYDVTFGWYAQVVDRLIAKGQTFPNDAAAYKHLKKLTGADPMNWPSIFSCLIKKTELRDGKKFSNGWHTPKVKGQPPRLDDSCNFSRVYITGASNFPELGKHPTPSVITGCGESPDAVKAVAAKVAAAKASAVGEGQQEGKPGAPTPKTPEPPPKSEAPGQ